MTIFQKKKCISSIIIAFSILTGIIKHLFFISLWFTEKHYEIVKSVINEPKTEESYKTKCNLKIFSQLI